MGMDRNEFRRMVEDLESRSFTAREAHHQASYNWSNIQLSLGLLVALTGGSGITTATASLVSNNLVTGAFAAILALIAGLLGAANAFLSPSDKVSAHKRAADGWSALWDEFDILSHLEMDAIVDDKELLGKLEDLLVEKKKVAEASPVIPEKVYLKVHNRIVSMKAATAKGNGLTQMS